MNATISPFFWVGHLLKLIISWGSLLKQLACVCVEVSSLNVYWHYCILASNFGVIASKLMDVLYSQCCWCNFGIVLSCYLASSTYTRVNHRCNEHLTLATALMNISTRASPHVWSHLKPHATSHKRTRMCGLMHDTCTYPCYVCNRDHTQSFIYTMHHLMHTHKSYTSTPPCAKEIWHPSKSFL